MAMVELSRYVLYWYEVKVHAHIRCPRCQVALGRYDTICWACRHVVKAQGVSIKYAWVWTSLKVAAAAIAVVVLLKYKSEVVGVVQYAIRSLVKPQSQ